MLTDSDCGMTDMRYRLKDRELQKKLDEISGGAFLFGKALNNACQDIKSFDPKYCPPIQVKFGQTPGLSRAYEVYFNPDQIEKYEDYNPNAWNRFPDVTPPEGVWMRCERKGYKFCAAYIFDDVTKEYKWFDDENYEQSVERFRPWYD